MTVFLRLGCMHFAHEPFISLQVVALIHADAGVYKLVKKGLQSREQHTFQGYVAVSQHPDDKNGDTDHESEGDEEVEIVVAWRGSILPGDWAQVGTHKCEEAQPVDG